MGSFPSRASSWRGRVAGSDTSNARQTRARPIPSERSRPRHCPRPWHASRDARSHADRSRPMQGFPTDRWWHASAPADRGPPHRPPSVLLKIPRAGSGLCPHPRADRPSQQRRRDSWRPKAASRPTALRRARRTAQAKWRARVRPRPPGGPAPRARKACTPGRAHPARSQPPKARTIGNRGGFGPEVPAPLGPPSPPDRGRARRRHSCGSTSRPRPRFRPPAPQAPAAPDRAARSTATHGGPEWRQKRQAPDPSGISVPPPAPRSRGPE